MIQPKPSLVVIQSFWVEHPDIAEQLFCFIERPGYGSFTLFSRADKVTHAKREVTIEEKAKPT